MNASELCALLPVELPEQMTSLQLYVVREIPNNYKENLIQENRGVFRSVTNTSTITLLLHNHLVSS